MTHHGKTRGGSQAATGLRAFLTTILCRFENLVSPKILNATERARQAKAIGGLVAGGLVCVLAAPLPSLVGLGVHAAAAPTIVGGFCLAAAAWLGASGRLDLVITAAIAVLCGSIGLGATETGGLQSPLLAALVIIPCEAVLARRPQTALLAAGLGCLVVGGLALWQWSMPQAVLGGMAGSLALPAAAILIGLHAATALWRLRLRTAVSRRAEVLRLAESRLVEETLSEAVLRFAPDGRLLSASRAAQALFAETSAALDADAVFSRIHVVDRVRYLKAFGDLRSGKAPETVEVRMLEAGAEMPPRTIDVAMKFVAVRAPGGGRLLAILVLARDVSAERRQTEALGLALEEARKISDAKTQFLAAVSHELRTPLNAIIGFSDVLDQEFFGGFENPRQKEYVGLIRQSGEHLLQVVNGLLDVSKIEAGRYDLHPEPFAIEDALRSAADTLRSQAERKGLCLDLRARCGGAEIVADKRAFHQILLNLLSNAVKFTEKGVVTLEARVEEGMLVASVCDTGIGIEAREIARLGQPFTQVSSGLSRRYQGTGLGLSLVKGLTDLHHGSLEIASEFGQGTMVTVRIPLDCARRIDEQRFRNETVVALTHARKKTSSSAQTRDDRRTA